MGRGADVGEVRSGQQQAAASEATLFLIVESRVVFGDVSVTSEFQKYVDGNTKLVVIRR